MAKQVSAAIAALVISAACAAPAAATMDLSDPAAALDEACRSPEQATDILDGATASEAELAQAQTAVRDYDAAITAYTHCLADAESHLYALHPEWASALGIARADRNDAAVALAEQVASSFNDALREFRARGMLPASLRSQARERDSAQCAYFPFPIRSDHAKVVLTISAAGEVIDFCFWPRPAPAIRSSVRGLIEKMSFKPATRRGRPVTGNVTFEIIYGSGAVSLRAAAEMPVLASLPEDIAAAHDKCLPAGLKESGNVELILRVGGKGRVFGVQTAVSSGSEDVDKVAACVARKLSFEPGRYFGIAVPMRGVPLTVQVTPRSQNGPADNE